MILLFAVLIWRGIRIAMNAKDSYGMLVATGITAVIAFQVDYQYRRCNEYDSQYGAAAAVYQLRRYLAVVLMAMVGMLLNISRYPKDREN